MGSERTRETPHAPYPYLNGRSDSQTIRTSMR